MAVSETVQLMADRSRWLTDTVQTEKESLNALTTEITSLLHTGANGVVKVVENCEKEAKFYSDACLRAYAKLEELRIERKEIQAELQQAEEGNEKVEAQLKECRNEVHVLQSERSEAFVALGMADKSATLNEAIRFARQNEKKTIQCELDELKAERASAELAANKRIQSLEAERDALLPSAGQLVVAQTKTRNWKQVSTSTGDESARLRIVAEATQRELEKEQEKSLAIQREVDREQEKSACHICFVNPTDALLLPCLHLHFCHQCVDEFLKTNTTCLTCGTGLSEVLKCIM